MDYPPARSTDLLRPTSSASTTQEPHLRNRRRRHRVARLRVREREQRVGGGVDEEDDDATETDGRTDARG